MSKSLLPYRFLGAFCGVASLACFIPQAIAANPQDQVDIVNTQPGPQVSINGVEDGHVVSSPNDPDLGVQEILKRQDRYQPFTLSLSVPAYYTTNVALANSGEFGDLIIAPAVGAFYDPRLTQSLYGHFGVREQLFYYADNTSFNFGAFDVEVGASYYFPQFYNLMLRAWYDYNRLTMKDSFDAFFENHAVIINAEFPFRVGRAQRVSIGTDANFSVGGDPDAPRRHDFDVYLGYGVNLTRAFTVDAVGRVVVRDYVQGGRVDVSPILALTATYRFSKCCSASAISSFASNHSNQSVFDYDVANIGGSVSFMVKF